MPVGHNAKQHVRAQRFVGEPEGKRAFLSARFPPEPPIRVAGEVGARLMEAERALCRLDGALAAVPDLEPFVVMRLRQEAVLSAGLAGRPTSLEALLAAEGDTSGSEDPGGAEAAVGCLRAMQYGLPRVREQPLDSRLLTEVHGRLLGGRLESGQEPGMRSDARTRIGTAGGAFDEASSKFPRTGGAPHSWDEVAAFAHRPGDLPVLIRIGLARAQFEFMRPFRAGHGRMGRLLAALLLHQHPIVREPVLLFSRLFPREGAAHCDHLQSILETGDWEGWLVCFLRGIAAAGAASEQAVQRFAKLREEHRAALAGHVGHAVARGLRVLERLCREPVLTAAGVQQITGTSYVAANQLVSRFVDLGILEEITGHRRNRRFEYRPYLRIFELDSVDWLCAQEAAQQRSPKLRTARPAATVAARTKPESPPSKAQRREADGKLPEPPPAAGYEPPPRSSGPEPISDDLL